MPKQNVLVYLTPFLNLETTKILILILKHGIDRAKRPKRAKMNLNIEMNFEEDEIGKAAKVIEAVQEEASATVSVSGIELSVTESAVLEAVRNDAEGRALRTVHRKAAELEDSITWTDEWSDERTKVQTALGSLRNKNLVRLEDRSYYPVENN